MKIYSRIKIEIQRLGIKILGPLISWTLIFAIGIMIKLIAFKDKTAWFEIAPEATFWAIGILFTLAAADNLFSQAKFITKYTKKTPGLGYEMDFSIELPDEFNPNTQSKYFYLFLFGLFVWVLNLFLSGIAIDAATVLQTSLPSLQALTQQQAITTQLTVIIPLVITTITGSSMVVLAVRLLKEATQ